LHSNFGIEDALCSGQICFVVPNVKIGSPLRNAAISTLIVVEVGDGLLALPLYGRGCRL